MKHPKGAIKSIYDLKEVVVPNTFFYIVIHNGSTQKYKWIINKNFKIEEDHTNCRWRFVVDIMDVYFGGVYEKHEFWSPYGDLHFPTAEGKCGYLFDNYWHAYAYTLKLKKSA